MFFDSTLSDDDKKLALAINRIIRNENLSDQFDIDIKAILSEYSNAPVSFENVYKLVDEIGVKRISAEAQLCLYRQELTEAKLSGMMNNYNYLMDNQEKLVQTLKEAEELGNGTDVDSNIYKTNFPSEIKINGGTLKILDTREKLYAETSEMKHAVMYYLQEFIDEKWLGYSVECENGEKSTVAYNLSGSKVDSVANHKSMSNEEPSTLHVQLVKSAIDKINEQTQEKNKGQEGVLEKA